MPQKTTMLSHCNDCGGERKHRIFYRHHEEGSERLPEPMGRDLGEVDWTQTTYLLQCLGCDHVSMRQNNWDSFWEEESVTYYPPQISRDMPPWMRSDDFRNVCPAAILHLLTEAYVCFQNQAYRSVAMCVRAILETAMVEKCGDRGSFSKNLDAFVSEGHLSARQKALVEPVIDAGSATIHRGYEPTPQDLAMILDLTETTLMTAYYHPAQAAALEARVPKRKKQAEANPGRPAV